MIRIFIAITIAIASFYSPVFSQYDFNVGNIPDSLTAKANSVIRHSHVNLEIFEDKMVYKYDYAITVLNKKHEEKLVFIEHFSDGESKVKNVQITIHDAEGERIKKIKKKDIKEYGLQDIEFANDTRHMLYNYESPIFPVTMHVTYRHEIESPYYIRPWYPISDFRQAVERSSIKITDHMGDSFEFQPQNLSSDIVKSPTSLYVELNHQKALTKESFMPDRRECFPKLELALKRLKYFDHVGKINNWTEFGAWIYKEMFFPKQDVDLSILKRETDFIVNNEDSDLAKAQKLYKYIQETTRYVLISLEDGGWSPLSISTVHKRKYGDCKALSYYYNTLCKAHGIDATLALVHAGDNKRSAKKDFYSTSQFNHVISRLDIEDQTYWVDCTSKVNPFNFLGKFTDDRNVLLFEGGKGMITKTPEYRLTQTTQTTMEFTEESGLKAIIDLNTEGIGITSKLYKLPTMTAQKMASYQKKLLSEYGNPKINEYSYEFDTTNLTIHEHLNIICGQDVERLGDYFKIDVNRNEVLLPKIKRDKNRVWPIEFLRNKEFVAETKLKHDLSLVPIIEDDITINTEFGSYSFSTTTTSGEILIKRKLKINKATYPPSRYNEIKSFFDKIKKVEKRSFLLSSKS